jgi:hypothetical protein
MDSIAKLFEEGVYHMKGVSSNTKEGGASVSVKITSTLGVAHDKNAENGSWNFIRFTMTSNFVTDSVVVDGNSKMETFVHYFYPHVDEQGTNYVLWMIDGTKESRAIGQVTFADDGFSFQVNGNGKPNQTLDSGLGGEVAMVFYYNSCETFVSGSSQFDANSKEIPNPTIYSISIDVSHDELNKIDPTQPIEKVAEDFVTARREVRLKRSDVTTKRLDDPRYHEKMLSAESRFVRSCRNIQTRHLERLAGRPAARALGHSASEEPQSF